jgi:hypothetical protein
MLCIIDISQTDVNSVSIYGQIVLSNSYLTCKIHREIDWDSENDTVLKIEFAFANDH